MSSPAARGVRIETVTAIAPPLDVEHEDALAWADAADTVVVGWGAAGACAALEARAAGASVIVVDRFGGGGASVLSGGVVYAGGGTRQQREAGVADTPVAMADYLRHEVGGVVSDATVRRFCDDSVANLEWLESHGVRFGSTMPSHKTSYPPAGMFLYHSGNELVPAYGSAHAPAPRGHRAVSGGQSGAALFAALKDATMRSGARVVTQAAVRRLVRRVPDGHIVGVEVLALPQGDERTRRHACLDALIAGWRLHRPGRAQAARREQSAIEQAAARPMLIRAVRGVILATGGYVYNPALVQAHAPKYRAGWKIGGSGCDGSGLRLGQSVGAAAAALGNVSAWRFITPPSAWMRGLVVNARGERFCNEQVYGAKLGYEMVEHQEGKAWLLIDTALRCEAIRQCLFGGLWAFQWLPALLLMLRGARKGRTLDELAERLGMPADVLRTTVSEANAAARGERDDPLGKAPDMRHVFRRGPFHAIDISIDNKAFPLATLSLGGLVVDERDGQVRDTQGRGIAGLFAAGRTAIGLPSSRYVSGLSLADCVFSGRRAGRAASADCKKES